jgi:hypothetical protein
MIVGAVDQQPPDAGGAHLAKVIFRGLGMPNDCADPSKKEAARYCRFWRHTHQSTEQLGEDSKGRRKKRKKKRYAGYA